MAQGAKLMENYQQLVISQFEAGLDVEDIMEMYPHLDRDSVCEWISQHVDGDLGEYHDRFDDNWEEYYFQEGDY
jgi:hypothetical protein